MLPYEYGSPYGEQNVAPSAVPVQTPHKARWVGTSALVAPARAGGTTGDGLIASGSLFGLDQTVIQGTTPMALVALISSGAN